MSRVDRDDRLDSLIRANASDLLAYLERRIDPRADAADILSEALIVAWRKAGQLPADDVAARMWLFTVARNSLLNARRSARRRREATSRLRHELEIALPTPVPDLADSLALRAAVAALPAELRELTELVHWEGFTIAEAAAIISVPASTARSRYAEAKRRLHSALAVDTPSITTTTTGAL